MKSWWQVIRWPIESILAEPLESKHESLSDQFIVIDYKYKFHKNDEIAFLLKTLDNRKIHEKFSYTINYKILGILQNP